MRAGSDVNTVGRSNHDDAGSHIKAVHLTEHLIQRLVTLVIA
jgi:hypothetical protein